MKKSILLFSIFALSFTAFSQKKEEKPIADTAAKVAIAQVPLLTIADMNALDKEVLSEMPAKYTDLIRSYLRELINKKLQRPKP